MTVCPCDGSVVYQADYTAVNLINSTKPGAELFAPERISWVPAIDGAGQLDTMPPS